ncbi:MAG: M12 family metallopeptidase [Bryobacteraceae bacterium]
MRLLVAFTAIISAAFAQDPTELKAPAWGWIDQAPAWEASTVATRQAPEGLIRTLPPMPDEAFQFFTTDNSDRVLVLTLSSSGAAAMRLHFKDFRLPEGAKLYIYGLDSQNQVTRIVGPLRGAGPQQSGDFWTRAIPGSRVAVEVQMNDEIPTLPFSIPEIGALDGIEETAGIVESGRPVERRVSVFQGMAVEHEVVDGFGVWQGDILLGPVNELEEYRGDKAQLARSATGVTNKWPNGVIPYTIDPTMPNQARITAAVAHWNTQLAGSISIIPRTTESYYVTFTRSASAGTCSSYIGRLGMAGQPINIGDDCSTGNVIHEIGHSVGLYHEHTRSDRAGWVIINTANITTSALSNFSVATSGVLVNGYDYGSIMHYSAYAFSSNGLPTIVTTNPAGAAIGQRNGLSAGDIGGVRIMYPATVTPPPSSPPPPTTITVTINSNPSGRTLVIDGASVVTPANLTWTSGTTHSVSAPDAVGTGVSYAFQTWSDGGTQTHTVSAGTSNLSLTANYKTKYLVSAISSSTTRGTVSIYPQTSDNYYDLGSTVAVMASAFAGNCFTGWTGTLPSTSTMLQFPVTQAYNITAGFQLGAVSVTPAVVVSAAAQTSQGSVTVASGCSWKATTTVPWITVLTVSGTTSGTVRFSVAQNTTGLSRTGIIYVNGRPMWVAQSSN